MPQTFFTSDHHFGHAGILSPRMRTRRPFASIEEHDETLIAAWNAAVRPDDEVWHLGDFAFRCTGEHARRCFDRLNGRKLLIRGNHDVLAEGLPWAEPVRDVAQVYLREPDGVFLGIWLSHYAHVVWPRMHRGDLHLYGHSHGTLPDAPEGMSTDVGVDRWNWRPVTLEEIQARLEVVAAGGKP